MAQLGHGRAVVAASGTEVQLDADSGILVSDVWITPLDGNTGVVVVGGPGVTAGADDTTRTGVALPVPSTALSVAPLHLEVDDLGKVWVDAKDNGDGVSFTYREP